MRCWSETNKELASICIFTSISHRKKTFVGVWIPDLLVRKLFTIDWLTSCAVSSSCITTLSHETLDYSMEFVAFITWSIIFSSAKSSEVFTCLWNILKKFENNSWFFISFLTLLPYQNVEEALGVLRIKLGQSFMNFFHFHCVFLIVNTLSEKLLHSCLLILCFTHFVLFD